jgi:hypothetical protein
MRSTNIGSPMLIELFTGICIASPLILSIVMVNTV